MHRRLGSARGRTPTSLIRLLLATAVLFGGVANAEEQLSVGVDVRINVPGDADEEGPNCNIQNEVSLARWGDTLAAGWNDSSQCDRLIRRRQGLDDGNGISISGYGYSTDGGKTWIDGGLLTASPGTLLNGDPVLAAGPGGVFYYATLVTPIGDGARLQIGVAKSGDGGRTWSLPVVASTNPAMEQDKPWLAVDTTSSPHRGTLYLTWTEFSSDDVNAVLFARSTDGGQTFSEPIKLSVPVKPPGHTEEEELPGVGAQVAVGPDGEVYVGWVRTQFNLAREIWITRSFDGGATFEPPTYVGTAGVVGHWNNPVPGTVPLPPVVGCRTLGSPDATPRMVINGEMRMGNWLSMAVDTSGSSDPPSPHFNPYRGNVYLSVAHDPDPATQPPYGDESDIAFLHSEDGGATWSNLKADEIVPHIKSPTAPPLNDDGSPTDQLHPQVAVDSEGRVAITWYDRRVSDPVNWEMEMYGAVSTDGGETFGSNFPISDDSFPPPRTQPNVSGFSGCYGMGEYNGMVGTDDGFVLAWGDTRDGTEAFPDPNVYFDQITFAADNEGSGGPSPDPEVGPDDGPQGEDGPLGGGHSDAEEPSPGSPGQPFEDNPASATCGGQLGNHIVGTPGRDVLLGTHRPDVICGLGAGDRLRGFRGNDVLIGGPGPDRLSGGRGMDSCLPGRARDVVRFCEIGSHRPT